MKRFAMGDHLSGECLFRLGVLTQPRIGLSLAVNYRAIRLKRN